MWAQIAEVAGTLIGVAYLYWEYRADDKVWIAGMLMPAISLVVYWQSGLYADFGINVYYLLAAVYGLAAWRGRLSGRAEASAETLPITHTPKGKIPHLFTAFVASWLLIGWLLKGTDSDVPWWDAFTTALSIVGMWMLARKWVEQWWVWLLVDVVSCGLYIYKGIYFYAALYGIYAVVAWFGYRRWKALNDEC